MVCVLFIFDRYWILKSAVGDQRMSILYCELGFKRTWDEKHQISGTCSTTEFIVFAYECISVGGLAHNHDHALINLSFTNFLLSSCILRFNLRNQKRQIRFSYRFKPQVFQISIFDDSNSPLAPISTLRIFPFRLHSCSE